jgi:hypothetical protein
MCCTKLIRNIILKYQKGKLSLWHSEGNILSEQRHVLKIRFENKFHILVNWDVTSSEYEKDINDKIHTWNC